MRVQSYALGKWHAGTARVEHLHDPTTAEPVAELVPAALDANAVLQFAREKGASALRTLTFHERAAILKQLAKHLSDNKEGFYSLSSATGATRSDSALDIEGGLGVLFSYASKALRELPNDRILVDGAPEPLSKTGEFVGQHIFTSRSGVAVQINAYNFPVWGALEKLAPALLAGIPTVIKPASVTSFLTARVVEKIIESDVLPEGSLQFIAGDAGELLSHVTYQDSISFTGSAATALRVRAHPNVAASGVRFTAETDSLNSCILGPDATPDSPEFKLFAQEIVREITCKAGQRCTAIRRAMFPRTYVGDLVDLLRELISTVAVGDPRQASVGMGPLVTLAQRKAVESGITELRMETQQLTGTSALPLVGADPDKGAFVMPTLLLCAQPTAARTVHKTEVFGPVCTLMPYDDVSEAVDLAIRGGGSLVASIFTSDAQLAKKLAGELAPHHGRVLIVDRATAPFSTGHGSPMPGLVHGGPGRAGGGEELGGMRSVLHHMQRTAFQASPQFFIP